MRRELRKARRIARKAAREIHRVKKRYGIDPEAPMPERPKSRRGVISVPGEPIRWADTGEPVDTVNDDLTDVDWFHLDATDPLEPEAMICPWLDGKAYTAACGKTGLRIVAQEDGMIPWPPPHRMKNHDRCRPCWVLTGKPRIRARMIVDRKD